MNFDDTKTIITPSRSPSAIDWRYRYSIRALLVDTLCRSDWCCSWFWSWRCSGRPPGAASPAGASVPLVMALTVLAVFTVTWGYFIFFETVWTARPGQAGRGIA